MLCGPWTHLCLSLLGVRQSLIHAYLTAQHGIQARVIIGKCPCRHLCQRERSLSLQTISFGQVLPYQRHKRELVGTAQQHTASGSMIDCHHGNHIAESGKAPRQLPHMQAADQLLHFHD
jgi:hypothetical protein